MSVEQQAAPSFEDLDFGNVDINAAFQEAMFGVASDEELELNEKVRRMEVIVSESNSELYRDFVDFRSLAAQIEFFCNHDHELNEASQSNENLKSFLDKNREHDDETSHDESLLAKSEKDKKEKKNQRFFSFFRAKKEQGKGLLAFLLQPSK